MTEKNKSEETAYIAVNGASSEEIRDKLDEQQVGRLNLYIHQTLDEQYGLDISSVALLNEIPKEEE